MFVRAVSKNQSLFLALA